MGQQSSKPSNGGSDGKDRGDGGRDRPSSTNQKEDKGRDKGKGRGKVQRRPKMRLRGHRKEGTDIPPMVPIPRIARTPSGRFVVDESLGWDGHGFRTEGGQQANPPAASTYPVPPVLWEDMGVEPRAPSIPTTMTAATNPAAPVAAAAARAINDEHGEAVPPSSPAAHPLRSVHSFGTSTARGWCAASSPAADPLDGGQPSTNTATTGGPSASSRPHHARRDFVVHAQPMTAEYAFLRDPEEQPGPSGHLSRPVQEARTGQQHTRRHRHEQRQQEQQEQQQQQPPSLPHQHHVQQQQQQQQEEQQNPGHQQQQSPPSPSVRRRHPRLRDMVEYMQRRTRRQQQTFSAADPWRLEERSGDRSQGRVRDGQQQQAQAAHGVRTGPSLEPGDLPPRLVHGRVQSNYGQDVAALPSADRPIERPVTPFDFAPLPTGGAADTGLGSGSPDPGSPGVPAISPARGRHAQAASTATVWDDVVSTAQQAFGSPNREFQSRGIRIVTPPEDLAPVAPMPLDRLPRPASVARPPSPPAATEAGAAQGECVDASRPVSIVGPLRSAHGQMTIRDRQRIASAAGVPFSPLPRDVASTTATTTSNVPTSSPAAVTAAGRAASRSAVSVAAAALATEQLRQFHQEQQSESGSASGGSNGSIGSSTWSFGSHRPGSPDRLAPFPEHLLRRQSHMMYREREQRRHRVERASRGPGQGERQEEEGGRPSLWSGIQRMRSEMQLAIEREDGERAEREAREAMRSMSTDTLRLPPGRRRGMRR